MNTGAKATGLEVYGINVQIEHCEVDQILAVRPQNLQCAGFSACGYEITFNHCKASNVQVLDENHQPNIAAGYGNGFGWAPDPRVAVFGADKITIENCKAISCQVGFDTWKYTNSTWRSVAADDCPIPVLVEKPGATRVLAMDFCSESPTNMPYFATSVNTAKGNDIPPLSF